MSLKTSWDDLTLNSKIFSNRTEIEDQVVRGHVDIDLASYSSKYSDYIKYQRLLFIAERCPHLKLEALRLAHDHIKKNTLDIDSYNRIFVILTCQEEGGLSYDAAWIQNTCAKATRLRELLETELKNSKANVIKEYIRKGSVELGDLYMNMGQLDNAIKLYVRSRDYCTSRQQDINMCLNVIKVAVFQHSWSQVSAHVTRAESLCDAEETNTRGGPGWDLAVQSDSKDRLTGVSNSDFDMDQDLPSTNRKQTSTGTVSIRNTISTARSQLALASGLIKLANWCYREAAVCFLQVQVDQDLSQLNSFITPSDLAFYVTLCSLATFDRSELKSRVLSNPSFRQILESEIHCREIINAFIQPNYTVCFDLLVKVQNVLRLDIFLADHIPRLFHSIRLKAMGQYFTPYLSADLNMMASAFGTTVASLENELAQLIQDGSIKARIDSHKQLLCALNIDQRTSTFVKAIRLADECRLRGQAAILRSNLIRHGLTSKTNHDDLRFMMQLPAVGGKKAKQNAVADYADIVQPRGFR